MQQLYFYNSVVIGRQILKASLKGGLTLEHYGSGVGSGVDDGVSIVIV